MAKRPWRILVVEDDEDDYILARDMLNEAKPGEFKLEWAASYSEALKTLRNCDYDAMLVDYALGAHSGLELVRNVVERGCKAAIVLMTGYSSYALDLEAMQAGAADYLVKGEVSGQLLERTLRYAIEQKQAEIALRQARDMLEERVEERTHELLEKHRALLEEMGERRKAQEELRRSVERAEALAELSRLLAEAGQDYHRVLDTIVRRVGELVGDNCTLNLIDEESGRLRTVAFYHPDPEGMKLLEEIAKKQELRAGEGVGGQVMATGEAILIPKLDQGQVRQSVNSTYVPYVEKFGIYSLIVVPLKIQERVIGTLGISRLSPDRPYTRQDQSFLQDLAARAALAIENSELFNAVQAELTERRRAEAELKSSKAMFERLFESNPDATILVRSDGCIANVNQSTLDLFGFSSQELIDQPVEVLIPDVVRDPHVSLRAEYLEKPVERSTAHPLELVGQRKNGESFPVDITLSPVQLDGDNQVICVVHDISSRKQAENALRESEARFRTVFEESAMGIKLLDLEGRILASNPAMQEMLGYSGEELYMRNFQDFTHPADLPGNRQLFQELVAGQRNFYRIEKRYVRKDGATTWGRLTVSLVRDEEGEPQFAIGMLENITDRKQFEAEVSELQRRLIDNTEAERLLVAQELHDGPMQDLYGITYQMAGMRGLLDKPEELQEMNTMEDTLKNVVGSLRSIAVELRPPTLAPFGLEKAIRDHVSHFAQSHPEIEIHLDLDQDGKSLPEWMRLALFRIYQQSMGNVMRHSQASEVAIRFKMDAEQVFLEIEDNGIGFVVPQRWITLARQGHMGLVGAKERSEAIGGQMEIISAPGEGTLIRVRVPRPTDNGNDPNE